MFVRIMVKVILGVCACVAFPSSAEFMNVDLRLAREDRSQARNLIASDQGWQAWLKGRRQLVDAWIAEPRDKAEWIAGWGHDFIDPVTQAPVRWTPEMPMPPDGAGAVGKFHQAWVANVRSTNFGRTLEAARLYGVTGDRRYADWAMAQLDFYATNYARWPLRTWNGKARMMSQSLDEATGAIDLLGAVALLEPLAGAERLARWREQLFLPIVDNLRDFNQSVNNIGLWHAVAISCVGMQFKLKPLIAEGLDGPKGVRALMKAGVTADGLWYEGTFTYNAYVLRALLPLFRTASLTGQGDTVQTEMRVAQRMLLAPLQLRFEDGALPTPGDANGRARALDLGLFHEMRRVLETRIGLVEAQRRKTWDSLLDPVPATLPPMEPLAPATSVHFEATRMAMLKKDGWQVFTHYGQLTQHHAQEEALSYELYYQDVPVSIDPGTVHYGSALHEQYFRRAIAHNVPLLDGLGQARWAPGLVNGFDADAATMEFSQPAYRPGFEVKRRFSIEDGVFVDRADLTLSAEMPGQRRLGLLFNTECEIRLPESGALRAFTALQPLGPGFVHWSNARAMNMPAHWVGELQCGAQRFGFEVRLDAGHLAVLGQVPATPIPAKRQALYLEVQGRSASMEMRIFPKAGKP